jgi:hypothetical protein
MKVYCSNTYYWINDIHIVTRDICDSSFAHEGSQHTIIPQILLHMIACIHTQGTHILSQFSNFSHLKQILARALEC